jgi:hypothetical protein
LLKEMSCGKRDIGTFGFKIVAIPTSVIVAQK